MSKKLYIAPKANEFHVESTFDICGGGTQIKDPTQDGPVVEIAPARKLYV